MDGGSKCVQVKNKWLNTSKEKLNNGPQKRSSVNFSPGHFEYLIFDPFGA